MHTFSPITTAIVCVVQILKHKAIVALPAFLLSSAVHDYHIGVGMGFFAPIFLIMFAGIGGTLAGTHAYHYNFALLNVVISSQSQRLCFLYDQLLHV